MSDKPPAKRRAFRVTYTPTSQSGISSAPTAGAARMALFRTLKELGYKEAGVGDIRVHRAPEYDE